MTANLLFFAFYVVLSRLSRTILCVEQEERLESRRQLPEEMDAHTPSQKVTKKNTLCVLGDEKGDTTHMQLLLDQSAKDGHRVKIFKSEKDVLRGISECSSIFAFQRGDIERGLRNEIMTLNEDVRVNHIQGTDVLTSKKDLMELGLEFVPERMVVGDGAVTIRKRPTHGGAKVFLSENEGSDMSTKNNEYLYQKYIDNALRIDGMPFDYGVYVFLSETCSDGKTKEGKLSYEVWDDVMLRFATNGKFVESTYTNAWSVPSLVNVSSSSGSDEKYFQAKTAFARYLGEEKSKALFGSIERHIDDAFKAARPYLSNVFTTSAFSLLRFDFVIDEQLYPWLIEVNASPNIKPSSPGQEAMLVRMLDVVSKKLFASEEDIVLPNELVRETDISKRRQTRTLAQSEYTDTDCVVSDWSTYKPLNCLNPCSAATHTQVRKRDITTHTRGNGSACPHLIESRVVNCPNACPPPVPPFSPPPPPPQWNYTDANGVPIVFGPDSSTSNYKNSVGIVLVAVVCIVLMM